MTYKEYFSIPRKFILRDVWQTLVRASGGGKPAAADTTSAYKFLDKNFKLSRSSKLDFDLRGTFTSPITSMNYRFTRKPYLNTTYFVYNGEKSLWEAEDTGGTSTPNYISKEYRNAINFLHNSKYTRSGKIYVDKSFLEKIFGFSLNSGVVDIQKKIYPTIDISKYTGVYSNPSYINEFHNMVDLTPGVNLTFQNNKLSFSGGGWYWQQMHKKVIFPTNLYAVKILSPTPFYNNLVEMDALLETEIERLTEKTIMVDLMLNDDIGVGNISETYSGTQSFNSGLYDSSFATNTWMAAKYKEIIPKTVSTVEGIKYYLERDIDHINYKTPCIYMETIQDESPELYMIFNTIPVRMRCNKTSTNNYTYTWPEYMLKNIELMNGLDYILINNYKTTMHFYIGKTSQYERSDIASSADNLANFHCINYINSRIDYNLIGSTPVIV